MDKLNLQITKGYELIEELKVSNVIEEMNELFAKWRENTQTVLLEIFEDSKVSKLFILKTENIINKFSKVDTKNILIESIRKGIECIQQERIEEKGVRENLDEATAVVVIRRILQNFYKHIQTMYQERVHGNGTIKKEDLDKIKIGNEYDVQRILYSIIRPVFPTARLEVQDDGGYTGIRYDIKIDEYNLVVEVKCTRKSMSERNLTEEIGSDAFHYSSQYIFFFIYDKECIIKNSDAFTRNYTRGNIEAIVNQPINI